MITIKIGCVPEHFSVPLYWIQENQMMSKHGIHFQVVTCPGGTGEMIQKFKSGELDMVVALTEGLIAHLTSFVVTKEKLPFKLVGTYTRSPLTWSIATHPDVASSSFQSSSSDHTTSSKSNSSLPTEWSYLKNANIGISRFGSGSHIIPFVMAEKMGWLAKQQVNEEIASPFNFYVLKNIDGLRQCITSKQIHAFLWERFTTKPYYDSGELYHLSNVTPPWPAFMLAASCDILDTQPEAIKLILDTVTQSTLMFVEGFLNTSMDPLESNQVEQNQQQQEISGKINSIQYIKNRFNYQEKDILDWFKTVSYMQPHVNRISCQMVLDCIDILSKAQVVAVEGNVKEEIDVSKYCDTTVANLVV